MTKWTKQSLLRMAGRHVFSEQDCRIQVLELTATEARPWPMRSGTLLAIVLEGDCLLTCDSDELELASGDQALIRQGQTFAFRVASAGTTAVLQMIWMPGISPANSGGQPADSNR